MIRLSNNEILFASLVGSKTVKSLPRFNAVQNELSKHVLPPIPFLPFQNEIGVNTGSVISSGSLWESDKVNADSQFFPLSFRKRIPGEKWFTFPFEPMITISGKNNIVKRSVAKAPKLIGTIKERWSQDDYKITITGALIGLNERGAPEDTFPRKDFELLKDYCTAPEGLEVRCEPLQLLGINYLVIEDFNFPFTKGENVQAYELNALSDFSFDFLLEIED